MPPAELKPWFVYLLRCANGCLYTGITTDVARRLAVHNSGKGSAYVRAHRPAKVLAFTTAANRSEASKIECAIKSLTRQQKLALAKSWKSGRKRSPVRAAANPCAAG